MIFVVDSMSCEAVVVESDSWIPLKITWEPRPTGRPLYLRISGSYGGEVEIKIDPLTGMLVQVIVLEAPPVLGEGIRVPPSVLVETSVPVVDRSLWGWEEGQEGIAPDRSVVAIVESLRLVRAGDRVGLVFSDQEPVRYVCCRDVIVAISTDGRLVEISAALQSDIVNSSVST
ncbi:hypothetical protein [Kribbella sp. C-35]|uniref:hypothetical protein n=1 Tax=Kribbella sp. C-35 TaxID=2789276 RepID=UPI00397E4B84